MEKKNNSSVKKICLINTPSLFKRPLSRSMAGGLGFDGNESMILPPLELSIMASRLRAENHEVCIIDADPLRLDDTRVIEMVREGGYSHIIAVVSLPTLNSDCAFVSQLRNAADTLIVKTMIREKNILEEILKKSRADFVIHSECDMNIHELLDGFSEAGTARMINGKVKVKDAVHINDLDCLPMPAWDLLPYDRYTYPLMGDRVMTMQTSRGCPFPCSYYCPYPLVEGNAWRSQSPERVFKEMKTLSEKHGIRKILFRDATFTLDKERIHRLCDLIIENSLEVMWWCETRVDRLDDELLEKMKMAGCAGMNIGVETGDEKVMEAQAKRGLTIEKLTHLREKARSLGIRLHFLLSKGFPNETKKSFVDTYELIMKLRPESLGITIMTPYPGTDLYRDALDKGWIESVNWEDYGGHQFVMHTDNLTKEDFYNGLKFLEMGNTLIQKSCRGANPVEIKKVEKELYTELLIWAAELGELRDTLSSGSPCENIEGSLRMSIIIPTYNRKDHLAECLDKLSRQKADLSSFEVIVMDDGSTDGTGELVKKLKTSYRLRYFYKENEGPGSARNMGVSLAEYEIVAFIGDDIMISPDFVSQHLKTHDKNRDKNVAVLGHIDWPPEFEITPFMEYITGPGGQQFGFSLIKDKNNTGPAFFYTSNISLKKKFLLEQPCLFDRDFRYAAYEDIELGCRLERAGMRIIYNKAALACHKHPMTLESFCRRHYNVGKMGYVFDIKKAEQSGVQLNVNIERLRKESSKDTFDKLKDALNTLEQVNFKSLEPIEQSGKSLGQIYRETMLFPLYKALLHNVHTAGYLEEYYGAAGDERKSASNNQKVSIVIPVFNQLQYTKQCLQNLAANTSYEPYEVIIVDDGSTDGTKEFLATSLGGDVKIVTNEKNMGFAKSCNRGARAAGGEYIVFLNNDTIPQTGWLTSMIKSMNKTSDIGIVGSKLIYPDGTIQHAGVVFAVRENRYSLYHIYKGLNKDHPAVNHEREFNAVTGACLMIRSKDFFEIGMFDEDFINGYEDVDLCLRVRNSGRKIIYTPHSVLVHFEEKSEGRLSYGDHNSAHFLMKWQGKIKSDDYLKAEEDGFGINYSRDGRIEFYELDKKQLKPSVDVNGNGNSEEELIRLKNRLDSEIDDRDTLLSLIELSYATDLLKEARPYVRSYLDLHLADLEVLSKYADICYRQGNHAEALESAKKILVFVPDNDEMKNLVKNIERKENASLSGEEPETCKKQKKTTDRKIAIVRGTNLNKWEMQNYEALSEAYDITAYTTTSTYFDISQIGLHVVQLPFGSQGLLTHMKGLENHLAGKDLIFSADITYYFSLQAVMAKEKYGSKLVCIEWENIPFIYNEHEAVRKIKQGVIKGADHFIAVSERAKQALMLEGVSENKIDVIDMGIDLKRFNPDENAGMEYRKTLGISQEETVVLFIGRMVWEKGVYDLVNAAARVIDDKSVSVPVRFILAGKGPELEALRQRASLLGISERMIFIEETPYQEIHLLHNSTDIFVLPSISTRNWQEQFGMVLIESMACGKPVISTLSGSIPEVIGDAGILVQPNDHMSLYMAIKELSMNRDMRLETGKKAVARAQKKFDASKTAEKVRAVFDKVMSGAGAEKVYSGA